MIASKSYKIPDDIRKQISSIVTPPERCSVTDWCSKHRRLSRKFSNIAGRWKPEITPYLREPLDAFAIPRVRSIVLVANAQSGKTTWGDNILAYACDD